MGELIDILPFGSDAVEKCVPVYETMPGWTESTVGVKEYDALPENAKRYLKRIEELCGAPIAIISTGPDRVTTTIRASTSNAPSSPVHAAHSRSGSFLTNAQVISTPPRLLGSSEFSSFDLPR